MNLRYVAYVESYWQELKITEREKENCPSAILYITLHINCPGIKPKPLHQEVGSSAHDLLTSMSW